jgi:hypothetical protein
MRKLALILAFGLLGPGLCGCDENDDAKPLVRLRRSAPDATVAAQEPAAEPAPPPAPRPSPPAPKAAAGADNGAPSHTASFRLGLNDAPASPKAPAAQPTHSSGAAKPTVGCVPLRPLGCLYVPASLGDSPTLIIYYRGHLNGAPHVEGWPNVLRSASHAFAERGLSRSADASGMAALVTGSSDLGVTGAQLQAAEALAGVHFGNIVLASHSGGFVGMEATMGSSSFPMERVRRVVMLDNFYSGGMLSPIRRLTSAGADCSGYFTNWSDRSIMQTYSGVCSLEDRRTAGDDPHSASVNACLAHYVSGEACSGDGAPRETAQL